MSFEKRVISLFLSFALIIELLPINVMAAQDEPKVTITATAKDTVIVKEKEEQPIEPMPIEPVYKSLSISADDFTINRDYEQACSITIFNPTSQEAKQFYLEAENVYSDLSYQFIGNGSADSPMFIAPGESIEVTLSVFAQNAEKDTYYIPIAAHVLTNGKYVEDSKQSVTLNCELPMLDLSWHLDSNSETSLSQTYTITNNGDKLTDLAVIASDELKDYVSFSPIISNYELQKNANVQFTVYPDLAKMKNENINKLSGKLIASCAGKTSEQTCIFDTKGKEITVTTMGKLGLKQDGNPFTDFKVDENSVEFQYYNGKDYVDISDNLELEDVISENGIFNIKNNMHINLGIDNPISVTSTIKSFSVDNLTEESMEAEFKELENGSIELTIRNVINISEFWEYFNALQTNKKNSVVARNFLSSMYSTEDLDDKAKLGTELVVTFNDIMDTAEKLQLPGAIGENKAINILGYIYDIYSVADDARKATNVFHNPTLSDGVKKEYVIYNISKAIVTGLQWAVGFSVPAPASFVINTGLYFYSKYLDGKQEALLNDAHAEIYAQILGHQCTNRGHVSASFHVPNYNNGKTKPSMHASSRMSGNGYVNKQDTNYDMTLNDKPIGTTQNSGLTDVLMTEIPTDNLIPGKENTIVFEYDTSPGSHSVTTDTEITLMYPNDTEIAYIGEPDDLQDVRTKPDFAVYSENIYADNPIIDEETTLYFNVYNTGSRGGWFTITCTDNETDDVIYQKENHYLAAFNSEKFQAKWTPKKDNTTFSINLRNTSVGLEERDKYATGNNTQNVRDDRNNIAEKTIVARNRQIPRIKSINANNIYENQPFSVIVDIEQCNDFESAVFKYKDKEIKTESTGSGEARRYCLYFDDGLPNGSYKIKAEFQYKKTASETATIAEEFTFAVQQQAWAIPYIDINSNTTLLYGENLEFVVYNIDNWKQTKMTIDSGKDIEIQPVDTDSSILKYSIDMSKYKAGQHMVSIKMYYAGRDGDELIEEETITFNLLSETESYYTFSVPKDVENASPKFFVYKNSGSKVDVTFEPTSDGQRFLKTLDIINNKADYSLVVSYDSGLIVKSLENNDGLIEKNGCNTLTTIKSDKAEIKYAAITRLPGISSSVTIPVSLKNPLTLSQGKYELTIHGTVDGVSFYQTLDIDVTTQDQVIDLSKFALIYYLDTTKSGSSANKYNVSLYIRDDDGWDSYFLSKIVDNESNTLKCYSSSEWILSNVEESNQVYMLVYSDTEVYFIKIKDTAKSVMPMLVGLESDSKTITLDRSTLNKVNLLSNNKDLSVSNVYINWNELSLSLYGDTIYIPDGEYKLQVTLTDGVQTFLSNSTATINKDCNVSVGEDIKATYSDVIVEWSKPFDSMATVNCYNMLENWRSIMKITSGNTIKALNGLCSFNIGLSYKDIPIIFTRELTVDENKGNITIGNELIGNFSSSFADEYQTEDSIQFSIRDVKDSNGNSLSTYYFDSSLSGQVIYKDIANQEKIFTVPVSTNSLYNISANLPNEPGEYSVSVILTLNPPKEELMYSVTVNDSYAQVSGAGKYAAGETVSISAGKRNNYDFLGWTSSDVTFNNTSSETTTFIMPAMDVSVTAKWKYFPSVSLSPSQSIFGGGVATIFTPAPSQTAIPSPSPVVTVIPSATPVTAVTAEPVSTVTPVPSSSPSPDNGDDNYNIDKVYEISDVATITLNKKTFIYNGKVKRPFVTVLNDSVELTENTDYTVSYYNNTKVGTATVIITGIGNYSGSINKAFKIVPKGTPIKGKLTAKHKGFIVKWKKQPKSVTGYQIQYSTNKKFKDKTTVIKTVKKKSITKLKVGKLKAKKKYHVRVRTYKDVKGKKYYSGWSTAKTIITKR